MEKKRKNRHLLLKLFLILIVIAGILTYAYYFPKTMELLDKSANRLLDITEIGLECSIFTEIHNFANKAADYIAYIIEIIDMNTKTERMDTIPLPVVIFTNAAFFPSEGENITSFFGNRVNPISGKNETHTGIDIAAPGGSNIFAAWPGKVMETGFDEIYGNYIVIEHSKNFITKYCHLSYISCNKNDFVNAKEIIGKAGNTGWSTGSHLHFEVMVEERSIDPMECFAL